jgi:hypothetical protein
MKAEAYLYRRGQSSPLKSVEIELTDDIERDIRQAAHDLLSDYRIELIPEDITMEEIEDGL